jgi:GH24 family phage-related lysozyme (muramidase)
MDKLKNIEGLSSLSKNSNDYIKPGGTSSKSRTPWSKVKSNTPIYSYLDSEGHPTIGWGSTFYDSVFNGNKKVKMGDVIDKSRADNVFKSQVTNLADTYSSQIKFWPQMSDHQRAGLLVTGFNAPNAPLGDYKSLTSALNSGDMKTASNEIQRIGVSKGRIEMEKSMLLKGPIDLTKIKEPTVPLPKPKEQEKPKNFIEKIGDSFNRIFRSQQSTQSQSSNILPSSSIQRLPVNTPEIGPNKNSNSVAFVNLAPIIAGQQKLAQPQNGTDIPDFSAVSFAIDERMDNASTYGVV